MRPTSAERGSVASVQTFIHVMPHRLPTCPLYCNRQMQLKVNPVEQPQLSRHEADRQPTLLHTQARDTAVHDPMHRLLPWRACLALSANAHVLRHCRLYATKSLVYETYGPPADVLKLQTSELPSVGPDQVLVEFIAVRCRSWGRQHVARPDTAVVISAHYSEAKKQLPGFGCS